MSEGMSVQEVSKRLDLSAEAVRKLLKEGHLRGYKKTLGETAPFVIYVDSVEEFERKREVHPQQ